MKIIKLWVDSRFGEAVVTEDGSMCSRHCRQFIFGSGPLCGFKDSCRLDVVHVFPEYEKVLEMTRTERCKMAEQAAQQFFGPVLGLATEEQKGKSSP